MVGVNPKEDIAALESPFAATMLENLAATTRSNIFSPNLILMMINVINYIYSYITLKYQIVVARKKELLHSYK